MTNESVQLSQHIDAPAHKVAAFVGDFRHAEEWMVGVQSVTPLGEDLFRLCLESPVGKIEPEVRLLEHTGTEIRWVYTSAIEGGGTVIVSPNVDGSSCTVSYAGDFELKNRLFSRAAKLFGAERFARANGERSLARLKHLMEARRY